MDETSNQAKMMDQPANVQLVNPPPPSASTVKKTKKIKKTSQGQLAKDSLAPKPLKKRALVKKPKTTNEGSCLPTDVDPCETNGENKNRPSIRRLKKSSMDNNVETRRTSSGDEAVPKPIRRKVVTKTIATKPTLSKEESPVKKPLKRRVLKKDESNTSGKIKKVVRKVKKQPLSKTSVEEDEEVRKRREIQAKLLRKRKAVGKKVLTRKKVLPKDDATLSTTTDTIESEGSGVGPVPKTTKVLKRNGKIVRRKRKIVRKVPVGNTKEPITESTTTVSSATKEEDTGCATSLGETMANSSPNDASYDEQFLQEMSEEVEEVQEIQWHSVSQRALEVTEQEEEQTKTKNTQRKVRKKKPASQGVVKRKVKKGVRGKLQSMNAEEKNAFMLEQLFPTTSLVLDDMEESVEELSAMEVNMKEVQWYSVAQAIDRSKDPQENDDVDVGETDFWIKKRYRRYKLQEEDKRQCPILTIEQNELQKDCIISNLYSATEFSRSTPRKVPTLEDVYQFPPEDLVILSSATENDVGNDSDDEDDTFGFLEEDDELDDEMPERTAIVSIFFSHNKIDFSDDEASLASDDDDDDNNYDPNLDQFEIQPGVFIPIRNEDETWEAVITKNFSLIMCLGCAKTLLSVNDAQYVACESCLCITPLDGLSPKPYGISTGLRKDDIEM